MSRAYVYLAVVAAGLATTVWADIQGSSTFDAGRFGEAVPSTSNFDTGRFGDTITQPTPAAAAPVNAAHQYTQQELDNFAKDVAEGRAATADKATTASTTPEKTAAENLDEASNSMCAMASGEAAQHASSDADVKEFLANNASSYNASQACIDATKAIFKACSQGNDSAMKKAAVKADEECQKGGSDIDPGEKEPQSAFAYSPQNAGQAIADKLANATQQVGNVTIPEIKGAQNTFAQIVQNMVAAMAAQQVTNMLTGASSSSTSGSSTGSTTTGTTTTTATCDSVVEELNKADPVVVTEDSKTTTTNVTTSLCANGNIKQVKTVAVNDGTKVTTTTTTTVTIP
ncbi:MAG: hypothetical protein DI585_01240 [Pseudomonas fluorescens]|nr:MAG: hypothetical protein DI585_01240 [Pseudomonas fluorescens]